MFKKLLKALRQASFSYLLLGFLYALLITAIFKPSLSFQAKVYVSTSVFTVTVLVLALEYVLNKEEVKAEYGNRSKSL